MNCDVDDMKENESRTTSTFTYYLSVLF